MTEAEELDALLVELDALDALSRELVAATAVMERARAEGDAEALLEAAARVLDLAGLPAVRIA